MEPLLEVRGLRTRLFLDGGPIDVVDDVGFRLPRGGHLGIVGESGSGKTLLALSLMRLVPEPVARIVGGQVVFEGRDVLLLEEGELSRLRGDRIAMVFQEPLSALNPVMTVGAQIDEVLEIHRALGRRERRQRSLEALESVKMPDPERAHRSYPHELSGGMRQRALMAMARACEPSLLVLDEPTSALDPTVQAQLLHLLLDLSRRKGTAFILISHELPVVGALCEEILVMHAGRCVERLPAARLAEGVAHPYSQRLAKAEPGGEAVSATGQGCRFAPACPWADDQCRRERPGSREVGENHEVWCLHPLLGS